MVLTVWRLFFLALVVANEQFPGDRDLIRERPERLLQKQQRRLEALQQLPGKAAQ